MAEMINQDKPRAYLDQNILDLILKNNLHKDYAIDYLKNNFQVVYSEITLQEIYKAGIKGTQEHVFNFIELLDSLEANYICMNLKDGQVVNEIWISTHKVKYHYDNFLKNNIENISLDCLLEPNIVLYGGKIDIDKLSKANKNFLNQQILFLKEAMKYLKSLNTLDPKIIDFITEYEKKIFELKNEQEKFELCVDKKFEFYNKMMQDKIPPVKQFRDFFNITSSQLNNIKPPNVLQKIYEYVTTKNVNISLSFEQFFQIEDHKILYIFQKVNAIYMILNLLGYYPDQKLEKLDKHIGSFRDMNHASYACFCDYFFTNDQRLIMKTQCAYQYLGVATQICNLEIKKE